MLRLSLATLAMLALSPAAEAAAPLAAQACLGCHGLNGAGATGATGVPGLAGRDAGELRALMLAFRANERPGTIMGRIARGYTEDEITATAEHFARGGRP